MNILALNNNDLGKVCSESGRVLKSGGIVILPTDTVYGIVGDARKPEVIEKIFKIKKRPQEKALPIFVKDVAVARYYAYISDAKVRFLEKVWPGQVTAVFHHKRKLPAILTGGFDTVGIRIPDSKFILSLLSSLDFPVAQTSANPSGMSPARTAEELEIYFGKNKIRPDLVIDGGKLNGKSSSVIDFTGAKPRFLRAGILNKRELDRFLSVVRSSF